MNSCWSFRSIEFVIDYCNQILCYFQLHGRRVFFHLWVVLGNLMFKMYVFLWSSKRLLSIYEIQDFPDDESSTCAPLVCNTVCSLVDGCYKVPGFAKCLFCDFPTATSPISCGQKPSVLETVFVIRGMMIGLLFTTVTGCCPRRFYLDFISHYPILSNN